MLGVAGGLIGVVEMLLNTAYGGGTHPGVNAHSMFAVAFSVIGALASLFVTRRYSKAACLTMIAAGILGFVAMTFSFIPPGVLLILAGVIGFFSKTESSN